MTDRPERADATLILVAYRHGLRASELCDLEWSQVEFSRSASLHVRRAKNGKPMVKLVRLEAADKPRRTPEFGFWEHYGWKLPDNFNDPDPEIEAMFYGDDAD